MRVLVVLLVLSVIAGSGWLTDVPVIQTATAAEAVGGHGPQPAPRQDPMSLKERREQTKPGSGATRSRGLPATTSPPATRAQLDALEKNRLQKLAIGPGLKSAAAGAAASYTSGALWQVTHDPFGGVAAQQGGFLETLGNYIGPAVPGEPLQVSAAIWQTGGADDEVHPVKVTWQIDDYCAGAPDKDLDFGQTVSAPTLNTNREFPVVNATITLPSTTCTAAEPKYFVYACTQVVDDPADTRKCGSYNAFVIVPSLPEGPAGGGYCGDASGAPRTDVMRADPVNTATGAFTECFTDTQVPAPGVPLDVKRTYSSGLAESGALGKGWRLPWEVALAVQPGGNVVLHGEGGAQHAYTKKSDGSFVTPGWARSKLAADGSGYRVTTADHRVYAFNGSGRLTSLKDRTGQGLAFTYTDSRPTGITDAAGRAASLSYTGERLDKLTLADGRFIGYDYTDGRLTTVTAVDGAKEKYGYDAAGRLEKVTDARDKPKATNGYDAQGRVTSQSDALGNTTTFAYTTTGLFDQVDATAPDGGVWTDLYYKNVLF
ncbi:DUF6531 domain-containing protein [Streptomyces sp. 21So2-11]|uniref:DUF6531 domain-containing protein n=1 Tax=Streptomyces sp. 21So2-11 TaxID=3144408 RepID=UPI00321AEC5A